MIDEVKKIANKLGIELVFTGHAVRLEDIYSNPRIGSIYALIQPTWQAEQKALEMCIRTVHELYVMLLVADVVNTKAIYSYTNWWTEYASDRSTAIVETPDGTKYTFWSQFLVRNWRDTVRDGWVKAMIGLSTSSTR